MKKIITASAVLLTFSIAHAALFHGRAPSKNTSIPVLASQAIKKDVAAHTITIGHLSSPQDTWISNKYDAYIAKINFTEGEKVKKGQLLITLDNSKLKAAVASSKAAYETALRDNNRMNKLAKDGYLSTEALDTANSNLAAKKAELAAQQQELNDSILIAPFAGTVGAKTINPGDFVKAGSQLVRLVNRKQLKVIYSLPQVDISKTHLKQIAYITTKAYPGKIFKAKISYISPAIDPNTGTFDVHALLKNKKRLLEPGEYVSVTQNLASAQPIIIIPESALQSSLSGNYVYLIKDGKAVKKMVTVQRHVDDDVYISKGLHNKEWVIVMGQKNISPGQKVSPTPYNTKADA